MNVLDYKQKNSVPLVPLLAMVTVGTCVTIEVDHRSTVLFKRIDTPKDVLDLCKRVNDEYGHSLSVYEVAPICAHDGCRLLFKCV